MKMLPFKILALLLLFGTIAYSQPLQTGFNYRIKNTTRYNIYFLVNKVNTGRVSLCRQRGLKANVKQVGDSLKFDFWAIRHSTTCRHVGRTASCRHRDQCLNDPTRINSTMVLTNSSFYTVVNPRTTMNVPTQYISLRYSTWEFGLTTIPFKYRFGKTTDKDTIPNEATTSVNAGFYAGRKWGRTRYYQDKDRSHNSVAFTLAGFLTPTVIALAPETTLKKVKTKSSELGLGLGVAALGSYRDISLGLVFGIDVPISGESDKWIYANKPWIGFGLGYKIGLFSGGK